MTSIRDPRRLVLAVAIIVLVGLTAFGVWHVVVGGLLHGNGRAAAFGTALVAAAGGLLAAGIVAFRRLARI
jgi:hypothetical protein